MLGHFALFFALACQVAAQCGPGASRPYPPGQTECPSFADGMVAHNPQGGRPQGQGGTSPCSEPPCPASLLGDVGRTTATGTDARSGIAFQVGENIYGPFEAGFTSQQDNILEGLGCAQGSLGHVAGGIDVETAEKMVAKQCSITLPRVTNSEYISLLDECGGHTREYHFHTKLSCLYEQSGAHSTQIGRASDDQFLYGKWEDYSSSLLPQLDACGGHFGITPDSSGAKVYHYHVQDSAPFTIGCFGPIKVDTDSYKLVTVAECRAAYSGCGDGDITTVETVAGSKQYDPWCPCYDATGSNVGTQELAVFADTSATMCTGSGCSTPAQTADTAAKASGGSILMPTAAVNLVVVALLLLTVRPMEVS